jgi:hypothetical protein
MSLHRRELIRRAATAGAVAWVAPSIVGIDRAAAMVSCPGSTTSVSFGDSGNIAGLACDNRGTGGYNCADVPATTTRGTAFSLPDLVSHTTLTIAGTLQFIGGWDMSGDQEDMFMIHLDGVQIYCSDNLSNSTISINLAVAHTACAATVQMTACVAGQGNEQWRYRNLVISVA